MPQSRVEDIKSKLTKPVALVGMMGAGKSHIGQQLAQILDVEFYDSDKLIEDKAGMPVTEIFEEFGEEKFRESEKNTILDLLDSGLSVIATGGGALTNAQTLEALKERSIVIWLDTDLETLWERVQKSQTRPLLQTDNPLEKLEALMNTREVLYAQAHIHADMKKNACKAADILVEELYKFLNETSD